MEPREIIIRIEEPISAEDLEILADQLYDVVADIGLEYSIKCDIPIER